MTSLQEIRSHSTVLQQADLSCGAAALATLLTYQHGDPVSEAAVLNGLIRRPEYLENPDIVQARRGFSLLDLKRVAEARGYDGVGYGQLDMDSLAADLPMIVPIDSKGYAHFVIVRAVRDGRVAIADPAFGNRTLSVADFEAVWLGSAAFGRVGFVLRRRDGLPPPNQLTFHPADLTAVPSSALRTAIP